jgi:dihydroxyacetone kinase-like predicted kinase
VVDAGAYGLTVIVAGVVAALRGADSVELQRQTVAPGALHQPHHESSEFRFCTNFAVIGEGLEAQGFVHRLEELGDSVLVVGDERTLRVHVHTDEPEQAVALFESAGEVLRLDVADMREQVAERSERLGDGAESPPETLCGALVVASGEGMVRLYEGLGARVLDGGPTMNPSTYELLAGIHDVPAHEVIVLPNSPNVIMAAERAAGLSEKPARVVPTTAAQEGLAALLSFDPRESSESNAAAVSEATEGVALGGVAPAAKDDAQGRFAKGEAVGYAGEELVAWGDPAETFAATARRVAADAELLTVLAGQDAPLDEGALAPLVPEEVELDHQRGDQPAWWWLLSAE